jgi:hypothetical protein
MRLHAASGNDDMVSELRKTLAVAFGHIPKTNVNAT